MKKVFLTVLLALALEAVQAQTFTSSERTLCQVQVAYAVAEGEGLGEYSITELIKLEPGESYNYRHEAFVARRIYSKVDFEAMFIVRFEPTGVTHFLDAAVPNGYEAALLGGCTLEQSPFYTRQGAFIIDASQN
jgi:hypothetical protein